MPLALDEIERLVAAAHLRARELDIRVSVAVVDEGGHLQALKRMDGAFPLSAQIAEAKAVAAAVLQRDGARLAAMHAERPGLFEQFNRLTRLPIIPAKGSVPIRRDDLILGAVGVSGASAEMDLECASAGLRAVGLEDGA